jgi:hypothetical protein
VRTAARRHDPGPARWPGRELAMLALFTGLYAYWIYAQGQDGPLQTFGRSDADILALSAWHQLPLHLAIAAGLALGLGADRRSLGAAIAVAVAGILAAFAALLTFAAILQFKHGVGVAGVVDAVTLLVLYATILALALRPVSAFVAEALAQEG